MNVITRRAQRWVFAVAAAGAMSVLAILFLRPPTVSLALDPRGVLCGSAVVGDISAQFELSQASDYRQRFPKMGISPELETSDPAFFVVYGGTSTLLGLSLAPPAQDVNGKPDPNYAPQTEFSGVICVVVRGERIVYVNVDTN